MPTFETTKLGGAPAASCDRLSGKPQPSIFIAKLIGEIDGHVISHDFEAESAAIDWILDARFADSKDQSVRGEVWSGGQLAWTRSGIETPNSSDRAKKWKSPRWLAMLGLIDK